MRKKIIVSIIAFIGLIGIYNMNSTQEESELNLSGHIEIREVQLGFNVAGRIENMGVQEGAKVKAGDLLASLDKKSFQAAFNVQKANIEAFSIKLKNLEIDYKRTKDLYIKGAASEKACDDAKSALEEAKATLMAYQANLEVHENTLKDTELLAPSDGVILTQIKEKGSIIQPGESVYSLSLVDPLYVTCYIAGKYLDKVQIGMKAYLVTDNGKTFESQISFISPEAEFTPKFVETKELRTDLVYKTKVIVKNPDLYLKQGMPVTVTIKLK